MLSLILTSSFGAEVSKITTKDLYGDWIVVKAKKYRGGILSKDQTNNFIGRTFYIKKDEFNILDLKYKLPQFIIKTRKNIIEEGVPQSKAVSTFYGLHMNRKYIHLIYVYKDNNSVAQFEMLSTDKMLFPFDGVYFYLQKKK
jgi:hypothetical protein